MKNIFSFLGFTIVAMVVFGCQKEISNSDNSSKCKTMQLVVNASTADMTKAYIYPVSGGYMTSWQEGDNITLAEWHKGENYAESYDSEPLLEADIVDGKASFKLEIVNKELPDDDFTYIAGNNYPYIYLDYWENADDETYLLWADRFDYTGEYVEPHMVVEASFSEYQSPTVDSFDSNTDVLVSKQVTTLGQPAGEFELQFARLGTIVKITLDDLDDYKGMQLSNATLRVGKSYSKSLRIIYDPILERYCHLDNIEPMSDDMDGDHFRPVEFFIEPQDVFVGEDGTAVLWLRTYAGELTDEFVFNITLMGDDEEVMLKRHVDLLSLRKTITFEEGSMTIFSVGSWGIADVEGVYDIEKEINASRDGFTATWNAVEHAIGYECVLMGGITEDDIVIPDMNLTPVDNGDGTWTVHVDSGLEPFIYYLSIMPIPEEGHALIDDYPSEFEMYIGVPTYWMLAHDSFGSIDSEYIEGTDNEYLITLGPGKIRYKNLGKQYQSSWQALVSSGPWFMYSTQPLTEIVKIQLWSKDDSHLAFDVYASKSPNEKTLKLTGNVIEVSDINVGSGKYHYEASHKLVEYVFPADDIYQYFTIEGEQAQTVLTSQYSYIYYYE